MIKINVNGVDIAISSYNGEEYINFNLPEFGQVKNESGSEVIQAEIFWLNSNQIFKFFGNKVGILPTFLTFVL